MFGRIFGRDKDDTEQAVCAECGRTLLAGEWTRKVTGPNGEDQLICSLCGPDHPLDEDEPIVVTATPANNGRVRETREDAPATPAAPGPSLELEAKDAEIAALREQVARADARNEELVREIALLRTTAAEAAVSGATPADTVAEPAAAAPRSARKSRPRSSHWTLPSPASGRGVRPQRSSPRSSPPPCRCSRRPRKARLRVSRARPRRRRSRTRSLCRSWPGRHRRRS